MPDNNLDLVKAEIRKRIQAEIQKRIAEKQQQAITDMTNNMSTTEKLITGAGHGFQDIGRKVTNLVLPKSLEPSWATDEAIAADEKTAKPLLNTTAGKVGSIGAQVLATAPVGGAVGGATKAGVPLLLKTGRPAGALIKTLAGALEGGTEGLMMSRPGERLHGSVLGMGVGGGVTGTGQLLRKTFGTGWVKMNPEAQRAIERGHFIPIGLGAEKGTARRLYRDWLPALPGAYKASLRQSKEAFDEWRHRVVKDTIPKWARDKFSKMIDASDHQSAMNKISHFWEKEAYKDLGPVPINISPKWWGKEAAENFNRMKPISRNIFNQELSVFTKGEAKTLPIDELVMLKTALYKRARGLAELRPDVADDLTKRGTKLIDDLVESQLRGAKKTPTARNAKLLEQWLQNKKAYGKWLDIRRASFKDKNEVLEFSPKQLTGASAERAGEAGAVAGRGVLQKVGQAGRRKLTDPIPDPGFWRGLATLGLLGGSYMTTPWLLPVIAGTSRAMVSKPTQRVLTGNAAYQKAIADLLRSSPVLRDALQSAGASGQAALIAGGTQ